MEREGERRVHETCAMHSENALMGTDHSTTWHRCSHPPPTSWPLAFGASEPRSANRFLILTIRNLIAIEFELVAEVHQQHHHSKSHWSQSYHLLLARVKQNVAGGGGSGMLRDIPSLQKLYLMKDVGQRVVGGMLGEVLPGSVLENYWKCFSDK